MKKFLLLYLIVCLTNHFKANAQNWTSKGPYGGQIKAVYSLGSNLFAAAGSGIYRSKDNGATWQLANSGLTNKFITSFWSDGSCKI
jgi:hypothetical protein